MRSLRMMAGVLYLMFGIAGVVPSWTASAHAEDIQDKIAAAKTPADHEDIAKWYDEQAKTADAKAAEHRKMGEAYKKGGGALAHKVHFHEHCEALVNHYTAEAKEDRALAAAHREMAKSMK